MRKLLLAAVALTSIAMEVGTAAADSQKAVNGPRDAMDEVASIVQGRVASISYTYDPQSGPRTVAHFEKVVVHAGPSTGSSLTLATMGGPLPNGTALAIPELPAFETGKTYIVFLTAAEWFYSPVVGEYAFRVEPEKGADRVVTLTGNPVVSFGLDAVRVSPVSVDQPGLDPSIGRTLIPDAARVLASAAPTNTFIADLVRFYKQRAQERAAMGDQTAMLPKTFKKTPRTDRVWNATVAAAASETAAMCVEADETAVCE